MNATINNAVIIKVTTRTAPALTADGTPTDFVSLVAHDGNDTVYLWSYATDLPVLPVVGQTGNFSVAVKAKAVADAPSRPRLSIRALSFTLSE